MRRGPGAPLAPGISSGRNAPSVVRTLTKGREMGTLFDQLRLAVAAFACGGGMMMIVLFIADYAKF